MRVALSVALALLASAAEVEAGPLIPIVTGVGAAIGGLGGVLGTVLPIALAVAGTVVPLFLSRQRPPRPDDLKNTREGEEGPGRWAVGRVLLGGRDGFCNSADVDTYLLTLQAFGPLDGIEDLTYKNRIIVIRDNGMVDSPPFNRPYEDSWMQLKFRDGDGYNGIYNELVNTFAGEYTDEHRQHGIATILTRLRSPGQGDQKQVKLFQRVIGNGIEAPQALARCSVFQHPYDPRTATRAWTRNGVLICRHLFSILPGAENETFDDATISDLADEADALESKIALVDFDGQIDIEDPSKGQILVNGTCVAVYQHEHRILTTSGSSTSTGRPKLDFYNVLTPAVGLATKLVIVLSGTGKAKASGIRFGSVTPTIVSDTTATTMAGVSVRTIVATGVPNGATFSLLVDGSAGPVGIQIDSLTITYTTTGPFCTLSGGGEGAVTVETFLKACESAGLHPFRNDSGALSFRWLWDVGSADFSFSERDIIGQEVQEGPEEVECPNLAKVRYFSPEQQYSMTELAVQVFDSIDGSYTGPECYRHQAEIDVAGEKPFELELEFCDDATQAARILRWRYHMERASLVMTRTNMSGLIAWGRQVFDMPIIDMASSGGPQMVRVWKDESVIVDDENGQTEILCRIVPDLLLNTPWDLDRDGVTPPETIPLATYEAELDTPQAPNNACWVKYLAGGDMAGAYEMRVRYNGQNVAGAVLSSANYRTYDGGQPNLWTSMSTTFVSPVPDGNSLRFGWEVGDFRDEKVDFRVFVFDEDENGSYPSDLLAVESLAVNNSEPEAPTGTVTPDTGPWTPPASVTIQVVVPREISVVRLLIEVSDPPSAINFIAIAEVDVHPEDIIEVTHDVTTEGTYYIRASVLTTDSTQSDYWEQTYLTPGGGP